MKMRKSGLVTILGLAAALAAGVARADANVCEGEWDVSVGEDQIHLVLDAEGEAFTGSARLARLEAEFSIWGFCSLSDGDAEVTWHSDIPTPEGSVYLTFAGVMDDFVAIAGTAVDIEGRERAFSAVKRGVE
jgi:hypothetical protein